MNKLHSQVGEIARTWLYSYSSQKSETKFNTSTQTAPLLIDDDTSHSRPSVPNLADRLPPYQRCLSLSLRPFSSSFCSDDVNHLRRFGHMEQISTF